MKNKLILVVAATLLLFAGQGVQALLLLPGEVTRFEGDEQLLSFNLPWAFRFDDQSGVFGAGARPGHGLSLNDVGSGNYRLSFSFLGLFRLKQVEVNIIPRLELVPSGHSIGVKLAETGVIVADLDTVLTGSGKAEPAKDSGFLPGDVLLAINGVELKNLSHAALVLEELSSTSERLKCLVDRGGRRLTLFVTPVYDAELRRPRLGMLLRDPAAGVGTMTFFHSATGYFGALGHMITDDGGGKAADLSTGRIVEAKVISIRRGQQGKPGEKQGVFEEERQPLGVIKENTELGIFGRLSREPAPAFPALPLGLKHEAQVGPAEILTVIEGDEVKAFGIEIEKLFLQNQPAGKGMVIRVTDPELLAATGGIIQGMSGSPIIQRGKLVGAVTHVFINEPKRGYGCFAEWMVLRSGLLEEIESYLPPRKLEAV